MGKGEVKVEEEEEKKRGQNGERGVIGNDLLLESDLSFFISLS